jgi:hypothetical protein
VSLESKNLIPYPYEEPRKTLNGVTFAPNSNGSIDVIGTPTGYVDFFLGTTILPKNTKVVFTLGSRAKNMASTLNAKDKSGKAISYSTSESQSVVIDTSNLQERLDIYVKRNNNGVDTTGTIYPQLEIGTTPTAFKSYVPSDKAVTVKTFGKNFVPFPYYDTTKTTYGITFTDNGDGSITINGQNDGTGDSLFFLTRTRNIPLPVTNYFATLNVDSSLRVRFMGKMSDNSYPVFQGAWTPPKSSLSIAELYVQIPKSVTTQFSNVKIYPQFELGSVATPYELFKQGQTITTTLAQGAELLPIRPNMTILTDTAGAAISTEYRQDTNVVVGKLYKEIENLKTTIVELGGTT